MLNLGKKSTIQNHQKIKQIWEEESSQELDVSQQPTLLGMLLKLLKRKWLEGPSNASAY